MAIVAFCCSSLYPFNLTVAPEWQVRVLDEKRQPIPGAFGSELADEWTLDLHKSRALCTDQNGEGYFPRQGVRASALARISNFLSKIGPHSSLGPEVAVIADGLGYGDMEGDTNRQKWNGYRGRMSSHVTLQKCQAGYTGYRCSFDYEYSFGVNSSAQQMAECLDARGRQIEHAE